MANLFSTANKIRKAAGYNNMTQAEAIALAKKQLANEKNNEPMFKIGQIVYTEGGQKARICCFSRGQMVVRIYSRLGSYMDRELKYNMDGTSPWATNINKLRLVVPTAA